MDFSKLPQVAGFVVEGEVFDPRTFLLSSMTATEAAAFLLFCWPKFTEYRGGVFLSFLFDKPAIDKWFAHVNDDVRAVESVVNHVHLWDVLPPKSEPEHELLGELAEQVGAMWRSALSEEFADRTFVVTVAEETTDYGPTVSFQSS
ncbi:hypothetical protein [Kutzneria chonburiensis]|uniref:Uncharacterized protein n=1 Tax=Kutzneria chonburiensis TaxID=1483604 RepID=A0ABV6N3V6_9PSEU|nr:hypothetical protein [Kutzneria chonburiensis]